MILKTDFRPFDQAFQVQGLPGEEVTFIVPRSLVPAGSIPEGETRDEFPGTRRINCEGGGRIITHFLGRYHETPPIREAIEKGYAFASILPTEFVVDAGAVAPAQLEAMTRGVHADDRLGALAAWAFQYSRAIDHLSALPAVDGTRIAIYGHSRFGKAALVAGAMDERVDLVIAHQSGRLGSSLTASPEGEPIAELTRAYPQRLSPRFNADAADGAATPSVDQHQLLALMAPRPVLIGHGRRDRWSDPRSAFEAARAAGAAYDLLGAGGFEAERLDDFDPAAPLAYWIRPGAHGETLEDWEAFFAFLDAHFQHGSDGAEARAEASAP